MKKAILEGHGESFNFKTTKYNPHLKDELKAIVPYACRTWIRNPKGRGGHWEISTQYRDNVIDLCNKYGFAVEESGNLSKPKPKKIKFELEYLGLLRHRGENIYTASGWVNNGWNATFPQHVLKQWFGFDLDPGDKPSLYSILSIPSNASGSEIKKAWRRAARSWHPDVCKEPDAEEQFKKIQEAYEKLKDPRFRSAYDAGLFYQKDAENKKESLIRNRHWNDNALDWKPPVRCGTVQAIAYVVASGFDSKYMIEEILSWDDIVNSNGETMVTYWPPRGDTFKTKWVR